MEWLLPRNPHQYGTTHSHPLIPKGVQHKIMPSIMTTLSLWGGTIALAFLPLGLQLFILVMGLLITPILLVVGLIKPAWIKVETRLALNYQNRYHKNDS